MDAVYVVNNYNSGTPFAATTGTKTVLNVISGANQPISIIEFGISFDGVTSSAVPAKVYLSQSTQAGAGTAGVTPTIVQESGRLITAQPTAGANYTVEPTAITVLEPFFVPQYMGTFVKQYPLGQEPDSDLSGGTVKALCLQVNVSANVNVFAYIRFGIGG